MPTPPTSLPVFGPHAQIVTLDEDGDLFIWEVEADGNLTARSIPNITATDE